MGTESEYLIEIDVVRPHGYDGISHVVSEATIDGHEILVDRDARSLGQRARYLSQRYNGIPVVTITTNEAEPKRVDGVPVKVKFRTKTSS